MCYRASTSHPNKIFKNVDNTFIIGYYHEEWHLIKLTRSIYPILGTDYNSSLDWGTDSIHTILHLILSIILSSQPNSPLHQHKVIRFITELSEVRALERESLNKPGDWKYIGVNANIRYLF